MARAREVEIDCDASFGTSAVRVVAARSEEVFEHSGGVLDVDDVERVHDMRVATRRLRAALEVFEPCFPAKPWRKSLKRVKGLADALGERRDLDVQIELFEELSGEVTDRDREAFDSLVADLRGRQLEANEDLARHVTSKRLRKLRRRLARLADRAER